MTEKIPASPDLQEIYSTIEDRFIECEKNLKKQIEDKLDSSKKIFQKTLERRLDLRLEIFENFLKHWREKLPEVEDMLEDIDIFQHKFENRYKKIIREFKKQFEDMFEKIIEKHLIFNVDKREKKNEEIEREDCDGGGLGV